MENKVPDEQLPRSVNHLFAAALLLFITLFSSVFWIRSYHTFSYWTSPDFPKKHHHLSSVVPGVS